MLGTVIGAVLAGKVLTSTKPVLVASPWEDGQARTGAG
jgi:hypothetical protein